MSTAAGIPDFRSPKTGKLFKSTKQSSRGILICTFRAVCELHPTFVVTRASPSDVPLSSSPLGQSNLARLNLPHPQAVFEIGFFRRNPVPCESFTTPPPHYLHPNIDTFLIVILSYKIKHSKNTLECTMDPTQCSLHPCT